MTNIANSDTNPMLGLFRLEAESQLPILQEGLAALHQGAGDDTGLEYLLQATISLKGAARIVSLDPVFELAQQMEMLFTAAIQGKQPLLEKELSGLDKALALIVQMLDNSDTDIPAWLRNNKKGITHVSMELAGLLTDAGNSQIETADKITPNEKSKSAESNTAGAPLADLSMLELFRLETSTQGQTLSDGLVALEINPGDSEQLERLMRAAHSLKGAARMVGLDAAVQVAHRMEDAFVATQEAKIDLDKTDMDILLSGVDMLAAMAEATASDYPAWVDAHATEITELTTALNVILMNAPREQPSFSTEQLKTSTLETASTPAQTPHKTTAASGDDVVRVTAQSLNRLLGLAGEALMESRWLAPYANSLLHIKKRQTELVSLLDRLQEYLFDLKVNEQITEFMQSARHKANECRNLLSTQLSELENYDRRSNSLSHRLHQEVLNARMRPFADGVQGFQRLVRDVAHGLDKQVRLEIRGLTTQVDRDILEKLQAPLNHMIRNAIDHGIESVEERLAVGKPKQGTIRLEAMHSAGMLSIVVQDDGRGIDLDALRKKIVTKGMMNSEMAAKLSESELLDFLFLPNFSTRDVVTEISGRGVGLDVVQSVMQELRGKMRASTELGKGLRLQFQLPLTLSVIRALVVEIAGEPYAFPLGRIDQTLKIYKQSIELMEGRQYFTFGNRHIGLVTAHQVLQLTSTPEIGEDIPVVVIGDRINSYGIVVDRFLGERNLVVHALDPRLGKVQNINAASLTEDGEPLLIFDADDMLRSIDILLSGGRLDKLSEKEQQQTLVGTAKRILVADDSITVREVERNLLQSKGYQVDVAVDGMDAWNAARTCHYDLIVSDIDMPRMNGFELVSLLKNDDRFKAVPVIIVTYKDREEDRLRGLEAGADYYLTKGSFHDDSLVEAVFDLIGEP